MLLQQRRGDTDLLNIFIKDQLVGKHDLIGIQIGSYRGQSAELFLKSGAFKTFYCIDPWQQGYDPEDKADAPEIILAEQDFDRRFKDNEIVKKIKMKSSDAAKLFEQNSIDFIYIDGNHLYKAVKEDLKNYFPIVKDGGIIAGHDYNTTDWHLADVVRAVNEFFNIPPFQTYTDDKSWIYIKNKSVKDNVKKSNNKIDTLITIPGIVSSGVCI